MTTRKILLLGSGYVTTTVVEYLTRRPENHITIANRTLTRAEDRTKDAHNGSHQVTVVQLDMEKDQEKLAQLVAEHDIVISLVPYIYHVIAAMACLEKKKHLVTTSYISPGMRELDEQAKSAGLIFMNEIGVDPGIDHLAAVKIINEARKEGSKIVSFYSWCGGLPAPQFADNPLKYKFSWSPRGVLAALQNTAKFLENGKVVDIVPQNLLKSRRELNLRPDLPTFEGYPNRNSLPYIEEYHIPETQTCLRGTLRYKVFCSLVQHFIDIGLADQTPRDDLNKDKAAAAPRWNSLLKTALGAESTDKVDLEKALLAKLNLESNSDAAKEVLYAFNWIGLFDDIEVALKGTLLDCFSHRLEALMSYKPHEKDMIMLQHIFTIEKADGKRYTKKATLLDFATEKFSSMARTTGLPCAITVQLILDGKINRRGVLGPMYPDMNDLILEGLEKENVVIQYETIENA